MGFWNPNYKFYNEYTTNQMSKSIEYCKKKKLEISIKKNRVEKNKITEKTVEIRKKMRWKVLAKWVSS